MISIKDYDWDLSLLAYCIRYKKRKKQRILTSVEWCLFKIRLTKNDKCCIVRIVE